MTESPALLTEAEIRDRLTKHFGIEPSDAYVRWHMDVLESENRGDKTPAHIPFRTDTAIAP